MNARLKELKLMALEKFASNHGLNLTHLGDLDPKSQEEVDALFSELIVRECAKVCRDQPNVYALKADRDNCAIAIEEHFGVE
jgi:hypothetical protein